MKSYIGLVGKLASIMIQNYAGLLANKLAYLPKNGLFSQKLANCPISRTDVKTQEPKRYRIFWELEEEVGKIIVSVISAEFHDILSRGFQVAFRSMSQ